MFAAGSRAPARAAVALFLRRARVGAVRGDLPAARGTASRARSSACSRPTAPRSCGAPGRPRSSSSGPAAARSCGRCVEAAPRGHAPAVHLVDVSPRALELAAQTLASVVASPVVPHRARYEAGLREAVASAAAGPMLALFLGSNIGNFEPTRRRALLRPPARRAAPGDALLLGADLVKPERDLLLAYDDPLGVTAAFNRNLLGADQPRARRRLRPRGLRAPRVWNAAASRVEMHLVSRAGRSSASQAAGLDHRVRAGETDLDGELAQVRRNQPRPPPDGRRFRGRRHVDRRGRTLRARAGQKKLS